MTSNPPHPEIVSRLIQRADDTAEAMVLFMFRFRAYLVFGRHNLFFCPPPSPPNFPPLHLGVLYCLWCDTNRNNGI